MIELPYKEHFTQMPDIDVHELVDYFNREYGLEGVDKKQLFAEDFEYLGLFEVDGFERIYWLIKGQEIGAVIRPFEDSYIIEMDKVPDCAKVKAV